MLSLLMTTLASAMSSVTDWSLLHWLGLVVLGLVSCMAYEQLSYQYKKGSLPGPAWTVPFLGGIVSMVRAPYAFWHGQMALGELSWNAIIGQYFVMVTEAEAVRRTFKSASSRLPLILHPNAELLLGKDNIAFLNGDEHRNLKHSLLPLFTQNALSTYLAIQERHIRAMLSQWIDDSSRAGTQAGIEMRPRVYDLNTNTSLSVFIGPYLTTEHRLQFQRDYTALTTGILGFPLYLPGTKVWRGKQAVMRIIAQLEQTARASKRRMATGAAPECLLDFWMVNLIKVIAEAEAANLPRPAHSSDLEVAKVVLDFLFASQDASTSSLTFTLHLLNEHPAVLRRVQEEQAAVRPDRAAAITPDTLSRMVYTRQVMREILRLRPPATIVPHIAKDSYRINDSYTAPPNTLIIPSVYSCNRAGWTQPESFDPDRWSEERGEEKRHGENFLTFGLGPHVCMGQRYAMNHIMLFIALCTSECEMKRKQTENMNDIIYLPTIYPADGCMLESLTLRA